MVVVVPQSAKDSLNTVRVKLDSVIVGAAVDGVDVIGPDQSIVAVQPIIRANDRFKCICANAAAQGYRHLKTEEIIRRTHWMGARQIRSATKWRKLTA